MMYKIANENVAITKQDGLKPPLRQSWNMYSSSVIIPAARFTTHYHTLSISQYCSPSIFEYSEQGAQQVKR